MTISAESAPANGRTNETVRDDEEPSRDVLIGSAANDWFFAWSSEDRALKLKDDAFAHDLDWIVSGGRRCWPG